MARIRYIKPGFFKNEYLAELEPLARLLFAGMFCWADREGRLEDRPGRLKAEILPYNGCDIDRLLQSLADSPEQFIVRYVVDEKPYIQISKFLEHQKPHPEEQASKIPPPPGESTHQGTHIDAPTSVDDNTKVDACKPLTLKGDSDSDSDSDSKEKSKKKTTPSASDDAFSEFWEAVPKKVGKQDAFRAWEAAVKRLCQTGLGPNTARHILLERMTAFAASPKAKGQYCPHPATWLNGGRYDDDPAEWQKSAGKPSADPRGTQAAMDKFMEGKE